MKKFLINLVFKSETFNKRYSVSYGKDGKAWCKSFSKFSKESKDEFLDKYGMDEETDANTQAKLILDCVEFDNFFQKYMNKYNLKLKGIYSYRG